MKPILRIVLLIIIPALAFTSCKTSAGAYFQDRLNDFVDVIPVSVAAGPGLFASVRATVMVGTGIGYAEAWRAGVRLPDESHRKYDDLARYQVWREEEVGLGILWFHQDTSEPDWGGMGNFLIFAFPPGGSCGSSHFHFISALDVEAGIHLGIVGLRVGVSPGQLIDFLLGWTTLDIASDDRESRSELATDRPDEKLHKSSQQKQPDTANPASRPAANAETKK
ncbi:MAG: hypothetical protein HY286_09630 [Planctomycetes bacterium]|nr:hypothetical protein [Planctomycetota bacterium]